MTDERGHFERGRWVPEPTNFIGRILLKPKIWNRPLTPDEIRAEIAAAEKEICVKGYDSPD